MRAGRVDQAGGSLNFTYSSRYLERPDAISIFRELPLKLFWGKQFLNPFAFQDSRS